MKKTFYFNRFDERRPYKAIPDNKIRTLLFQGAGILTIALGIAYLHWRWRFSLNPDAMWFSIMLVLAETFSFISTAMIIINFWSFKDAPKAAPVKQLSEIEKATDGYDRFLGIDVFIATYNEDVELVRYSIQDAKKMIYPPEVNVKIYVLDDGRRDGRNPEAQNMKKVAEEEGVNYLLREHNKGYKAGNLKNALEQTSGDLFVILDADTRVFPEFLINTTGYFRNHKVAWVQTPQWFYDTTEPEKVSEVIRKKFKIRNRALIKCLELLFGKVRMNEDIYGNDPRLFYDVILRKRNYYNAAFCCGAGSIHRREAIMGLALRDFVNEINKNLTHDHDPEKTSELVLQQEIIPFKFHASEDIYTSIMLHADKENRWQSIQHPDIECKMLSPQDLDSWIKQHKRYAEGSLDIALRDNPLFKKGLTWGQKLCYFSTIWSYFAPFWIFIFLISPIIFFFSLELPVRAYSFDFFKYFIPFQVMNTVTITLGCWGISTRRGDQYYISSFWFMLQSFYTVVRGKKVRFNVTPKDIQANKNLPHILPHIILIALTVAGIVYNAYLVVQKIHPTTSGFAANTFWCLFNIASLSIMIRAAYWRPEVETQQEVNTK